MNYKSNIFVTGITNLSDARYAAGMMVDLLGFCIEDEHESSITLDQFEAIINWIEGIEFVGEFYTRPVEDINDLVEKYGLSYVQLPASRIHEVPSIKAKVILKIDDEKIKDLLSDIDLVYSVRLGSNVNMDELSSFAKKVFLEASSHNIDLLKDNPPFGVCILGGIEERPGYKDYDEIGDFLEKLEV